MVCTFSHLPMSTDEPKINLQVHSNNYSCHQYDIFAVYLLLYFQSIVGYYFRALFWELTYPPLEVNFFMTMHLLIEFSDIYQLFWKELEGLPYHILTDIVVLPVVPPKNHLLERGLRGIFKTTPSFMEFLSEKLTWLCTIYK